MRGRRLGRGLLVGAALALVLYVGVSWLFSERLIAPDPRPLGSVDAADYGLPKPEATTVPGDGVRLAAWYFDNPRRERCAVVMLHGFGGQRAEVVAPTSIFWRRGCDLLLYDARGHGESSPALLSFGANERRDLKLVVDWLARRTELPQSRIGLIGWSYGAATAIQAAAELPEIAFVVSDSSFSSLGDITRVQAEEQFGTWAKIFVPGALVVSGFGRASTPATPLRSTRSTTSELPCSSCTRARTSSRRWSTRSGSTNAPTRRASDS